MNLAQFVIDVGVVVLIAMVTQASKPTSQRELFYQNRGKLLRTRYRTLTKAVCPKDFQIAFRY